MSPNIATNLKIFGLVIATLGVYTWVANAIPQLESEVPEEVSFTGAVSADELVSAGEDLFGGAGGCTACHGLGTRAPELREDFQGEGPIGARCGERIEGMSCKDYLYESMVAPNEHMVEGFPPIMPPQDRILTDNQIWAIIAYLQSLGGEVTVTAEDVQGEDGNGAPPASGADEGAEGGDSPPGGNSQAGGSAPAGSAGGTEGSSPGQDEDSDGSPDAVALMEANACFGCHTLGDRGMEIGPPLDDIGSRRSVEYLRRSIVDPGAEVPEGYESVAGSMPPNFGQILSDPQLDAIVSFLAEQTDGGGE